MDALFPERLFEWMWQKSMVVIGREETHDMPRLFGMKGNCPGRLAHVRAFWVGEAKVGSPKK